MAYKITSPDPQVQAFMKDIARQDVYFDEAGNNEFIIDGAVNVRAALDAAIAALPPSSDVVVPAELLTRTFAVQHNPNCPAPWLVRMPGKSCIIDFKPYRDQLGIVAHQTGDILGFGKTLAEASSAALAQEGQSE